MDSKGAKTDLFVGVFILCIDFKWINFVSIDNEVFILLLTAGKAGNVVHLIDLR